MNRKEVIPLSSPVEAVSRFFTSIWLPPILDQKTIDFRQRSLSVMRDTMNQYNVDPSQYIAIPGGSFRMIANENPGYLDHSDYDYVMYCFSSPDDLLIEAKKSLGSQKYPDNETNLQVHEIYEVTPEGFWSEAGKLEFALLTTPSDYLVGDVQRANYARLQIMDAYGGFKEQDGFWRHVINFWFTKHFLEWRDSSFKRRDRFERNLAQRSLMEGDSANLWEEAFMRSFTSLTLPSFGIYHDALKQTKGALWLDPKYALQGIE